MVHPPGSGFIYDGRTICSNWRVIINQKYNIVYVGLEYF